MCGGGLPRCSRRRVGVPKMIVRRPLNKLKLPHQRQVQPVASLYLLRGESLAQRPGRAPGRFPKEQSQIFSGWNRRCSRARVADVNPLRVWAAYRS